MKCLLKIRIIVGTSQVHQTSQFKNNNLLRAKIPYLTTKTSKKSY